jgi:hypothetical protein
VIAAALAVALGLMLAACTHKQKGARDGPVPYEKSPLPALADPMPVPPGGDEQAAEALAVALSRPDGSIEPALITAYAMVGVPVSRHDGSLVNVPGQPVSGPPVPGWVVQSLAATARGAPLLNLAHLADVLTSQPEFGRLTNLGTLLKQDWADAFQSTDPGTVRLASLLLAAGESSGPASSGTIAETPPDQLDLTAIQVQLLLRRLAVELVAGNAPQPPSAQPRLVPAHRLQDTPCSPPDPGADPVGNLAELKHQLFNGLAKALASGGDKNPAAAKAAGLLVAVANHLLLLAALHAQITLVNSPLVRKKNRDAGETRTLDVDVRFDLGGGAQANCWLLVLNKLGIAGFKPPVAGPGKDLRIQFKGREGARDLDKDPLISIDKPTEKITDQHGHTSTSLIGWPRKETLTADAPPVDKTAKVDVLVFPKEVSFYKDLISVLKSAKDGPAKVMLETLERMNPVTFHTPIPVRDWQGGRQFTFHGTHTWGRTGPFTSANQIDSDGSSSFTGVMACLPPDQNANPKVWICTGNAVVNGHGMTYRWGDTYPDPNHDDCAERWQSINVQFRFNAYSDNERLESVKVTVDPNHERQFKCGFAAGAPFPLDVALAPDGIILPEPRETITGSLAVLDPERGSEGLSNGTVNATIKAEN